MHEVQIVSADVRGGAPHFAGRPGRDEYAEYYARYVDRVPTGDVVRTLEASARETDALLRSEPARARGDHAYAEGKWTLKEVVGHVIDAERVFAYRMLRIGRGDTTPLASFDENAWAPAGEFVARSIESLVGEFLAVRTATFELIRGLPEAAWTRRGIAAGQEVSVRALAHIIAGHEMHHRAILEQRYLAERR